MKRRHAFELVDGPVGIEHRFLREVFSIVMVAAVFQRQSVETPLVIGSQFTKGFHISILGPRNQICLLDRTSAFLPYRHNGPISVGEKFQPQMTPMMRTEFLANRNRSIVSIGKEC